jgi:hypothetical protein
MNNVLRAFVQSRQQHDNIPSEGYLMTSFSAK